MQRTNGLAVQIALSVLGALVLVALASDAFTNAVEWIGKIFGLTRSAAGAIVAAIGSALPQAMVAVVGLIVPRGPLPVRLNVTTFGLLLFGLTFALVIGASFAPTFAVRVSASIAALAAYA